MAIKFESPAELVTFLRDARASGVVHLELSTSDGDHIKVALTTPPPKPGDAPEDDPLFDGVKE